MIARSTEGLEFVNMDRCKECGGVASMSMSEDAVIARSAGEVGAVNISI